jgi:AcrR family transcriptional regulator/DNA-binding XRE family transcriptional regulator
MEATVVPRLSDAPEIGARVRAAREQAGLTLRSLARALDVSPATLSGLETGKTPASDRRLAQIAQALRTTPEGLLHFPVPATPRGASRRELHKRAAADGRMEIADWRVYAPLPLDPVLVAALELFVTTGYHGTTVRDVARKCGMSVSGMYHYHPSKQDMLVQILELGVSELLTRAELARQEGSDPVERFSLMIESLVLFHTHRREVGFVGASEMRSLEPEARRRIAAGRMQQQRMIDQEVVAAVDRRLFRTPFPYEASRAVVTMCTSVAQWFNLGGQQPPATVAEEYVRFARDLMRFETP